MDALTEYYMYENYKNNRTNKKEPQEHDQLSNFLSSISKTIMGTKINSDDKTILDPVIEKSNSPRQQFTITTMEELQSNCHTTLPPIQMSMRESHSISQYKSESVTGATAPTETELIYGDTYSGQNTIENQSLHSYDKKKIKTKRSGTKSNKVFLPPLQHTNQYISPIENAEIHDLTTLENGMTDHSFTDSQKIENNNISIVDNNNLPIKHYSKENMNINESKIDTGSLPSDIRTVFDSVPAAFSEENSARSLASQLGEHKAPVVTSKDITLTVPMAGEPYSYEELLENLKLLGQVKQESKLLINSGCLEIDNRVGQSVRRWFTSDSRESTHDVLKKIINSAEIYSEQLISVLKVREDSDTRHKLQNLIKDLAPARVGLRNLIITYRDDERYMAKLDICIDAIAVRIEKNMNFDSKQ